MQIIAIDQVIILDHQRETNPAKVAKIAETMKQRGYNVSYPITLNSASELVDGGHRVEAARLAGITEVPYVLKPEGVSDIQHAINCNADGATTKEYDVFDYAHHCYTRAQQGWTGQMIADELGEGWSKSKVSLHISIKKKLCQEAWNLARDEFTRNQRFANINKNGLVNREFTIVNWAESHFRALFQHLTYDPDNPNELITWGQVRVVQLALDCFAGEIKDEDGRQQKVTADWIDGIAQKFAWYVRLKQAARNVATELTPPEILTKLDGKIEEGIYGAEPDESKLRQVQEVVKAATFKAPRLYLGLAEDMYFLEDESIDLIITSPPYNLGKDKWPMGGQGRTPRENGIGYDGYDDDMPEPEYQAWQLACLQEIYRVAKDGASFFYNHKVRSRDGQIIHPMEWLGHESNPWTVRQEIIWDRGSTHNHNKSYFWPHDERIYWLTKGKPTLPNKPIGIPSIWAQHGPVPNTDGPAPFPPELPRMCMAAIGRPGLVVLDPFAGTCTTIIVAVNEFGYDSVGIDKSKEELDKVAKKTGWTIESKI